ncbi:hypothetical protein [Saccharopolyspora flava]|uniref:VIT family protein n=1 Tax=Saccharopolyspora flava TaxID=95161 RepID=A0A1I6V4F4_9PSEU|nr:hypothetical protein [Saccharopolyspora flava]SFT08524.1 hypothetical protein SAMN05660874_05589 [Saccharopolyspora flava]
MTAARRSTLAPEQIASLLRERIYGGIACLSTLLVLLRHLDESPSAWSAFLDVAVTNGSLWAASLFADYLAHLTAHGKGPRGAELLHALRASGQILEAAIAPLLLVLLAALGVLPLHIALWTAVGLSVGALGLFALLAARRTRLPWWKRILIVLVLLALGILVVGIKILSH